MKHTVVMGLIATTLCSIGLLSQTPAQAVALQSEFLDQTASPLYLEDDVFNFFNSKVNQERQWIEDSDLNPLNASSLFWNGVDPVEVYFINEGAGYRNQLFFTANEGAAQGIFSDVSSKDSILSNSNGPLQLGQGYSLGSFEGMTQLDFLIKADGFNNSNGKVYGSVATENPDGLEHVNAFEYQDAQGESWVMLGFEDLYGIKGSDRDFNDVVFVVKGIQQDAPSSSVPEPSFVMGMLVLGAGGLTRLRRPA